MTKRLLPAITPIWVRSWISVWGMAFYYMELAKDTGEKTDTVVICDEKGLPIDYVPCRVIDDTVVSKESPLSSIVIRLRRVEFCDLNQGQEALLKEIITSGDRIFRPRDS